MRVVLCFVSIVLIAISVWHLIIYRISGQSVIRDAALYTAYFKDSKLEDKLDDMSAEISFGNHVMAADWTPPPLLHIENYVSFIYITGTNIQYPVVRGENNSYYLNHSIYREKNAHGAIFMDYRNMTPFTQDYNTIIYGHNMRDNTMFGELNEILNNSEKSIIHIHYDGRATIWKVFASYMIDTESWIYDIAPSNNKDYLDSVAKISESVFPEEVYQSSNILTLSTCDVTGKYRVIVQAARLK